MAENLDVNEDGTCNNLNDQMVKIRDQIYSCDQGLDTRTEPPACTPNTLTSHLATVTNHVNKKTKKANLGTVMGVYLPTVQHIFGVIMFLRLFWIVGCMGLYEAFFMVSLCCLCTLLTSISTSAIATNGKVEGAGAYYMISRNLGPAVGCAVGLLFYVANAVACAMYLVGSVEIFLLYLAPPSATIGGVEAHQSHGITGMLSHNLRIYGTGLLLLQFAIVACGVKVVQCFAPISLFCVIVSVISVYAGAIQKSLDDSGPYICLANAKLLRRDFFVPSSFKFLDKSVCQYCNHSAALLRQRYCNDSSSCLQEFEYMSLECKRGMPGFSSGILFSNLNSLYKKDAMSSELKGKPKMFPTNTEHTSFWILLSIFYPSVTGIMTGTNMAGDLQDSQKSIPTGTIAAQLTTSLVYLSFVVIFSGSIEGSLLRDKWGSSLGGRMVVSEFVWPIDWILLIGSFTSTFGAALQCLCSAPRLLQSIAIDEVLPHMTCISKRTKFNEPFVALIVTSFISFTAIMIGVLDYIAPLVELFFLICYAFVNLACVLAAVLRAPNWRPRFRFYHWSISLCGFCLCIFIMFATSWYYTLGAMTIGSFIFGLVHWVGDKKEWGDGFTGLCLNLVHYFLLQVRGPVHVKNWRPQLLVLLDSKMKWHADGRNRLFHFCQQLKKGHGFTLLMEVFQGNSTEADVRRQMLFHQQNLDAQVHKISPTALTMVLLYPEGGLHVAIDTAVQSVGIGQFQPNTILLVWPSSHSNKFSKMLYDGFMMDKCVLILRGIAHFPTSCQRLSGFIDIWWILEEGGLLLLLAFLLRRHRTWKYCNLRLFVVLSKKTPTSSNECKEKITKWLYQIRIDATVEIVALNEEQLVAYGTVNTLHRNSKVIQMAEKLHNHQMRSYQELCEDKAQISAQNWCHSRKEAESAYGINEFASFVINNSQPPVPTYEQSEENILSLQLKCAQQLNKLIFSSQRESQLTIINLPEPPKANSLIEDYIQCLEQLTTDITRVLLVRGSGSEFVTMYC